MKLKSEIVLSPAGGVKVGFWEVGSLGGDEKGL